MQHSRLLLMAALLLASCASSSTPPAAAPSATVASAKPDSAKAKAHLNEHVTYPAKRADILAACADTPEFTSAEKQWLSDNLPDGEYHDAGQVIRALHL